MSDSRNDQGHEAGTQVTASQDKSVREQEAMCQHRVRYLKPRYRMIAFSADKLSG